jgi:hypothetical protein
MIGSLRSLYDPNYIGDPRKGLSLPNMRVMPNRPQPTKPQPFSLQSASIVHEAY